MLNLVILVQNIQMHNICLQISPGTENVLHIAITGPVERAYLHCKTHPLCVNLWILFERSLHLSLECALTSRLRSYSWSIVRMLSIECYQYAPKIMTTVQIGLAISRSKVFKKLKKEKILKADLTLILD